MQCQSKSITRKNFSGTGLKTGHNDTWCGRLTALTVPVRFRRALHIDICNQFRRLHFIIAVVTNIELHFIITRNDIVPRLEYPADFLSVIVERLRTFISRKGKDDAAVIGLLDLKRPHLRIHGDHRCHNNFTQVFFTIIDDRKYHLTGFSIYRRRHLPVAVQADILACGGTRNLLHAILACELFHLARNLADIALAFRRIHTGIGI